MAASISRYRMVRHRPRTRWGRAHAGARSALAALVREREHARWKPCLARVGSGYLAPQPRTRGKGGDDMAGGAVVSSWRCPGSPMMGEELNASDVTDRGLLGDRSLAVVDIETTKVGSATNPKEVADVVRLPGGLHHATGAGERCPAGSGDAARRRDRHLRRRRLGGAHVDGTSQTGDLGDAPSERASRGPTMPHPPLN